MPFAWNLRGTRWKDKRSIRKKRGIDNKLMCPEVTILNLFSWKFSQRGAKKVKIGRKTRKKNTFVSGCPFSLISKPVYVAQSPIFPACNPAIASRCGLSTDRAQKNGQVNFNLAAASCWKCGKHFKLFRAWLSLSVRHKVCIVMWALAGSAPFEIYLPCQRHVTCCPLVKHLS